MERSFGALAHLGRGEQHFGSGPQRLFGLDTLDLLQPHGNEEPQDEDSDTEPDSGCDIQAAHVDNAIVFGVHPGAGHTPGRPARLTYRPELRVLAIDYVLFEAESKVRPFGPIRNWEANLSPFVAEWPDLRTARVFCSDPPRESDRKR